MTQAYSWPDAGEAGALPPEAAERLARVPESLRSLLRELWYASQRNERDPRFERREAAEQRAEEARELELLESMASKAQRGAYGERASEVAQHVLDQGRFQDRRAVLLELRRALQQLPDRISA